MDSRVINAPSDDDVPAWIREQGGKEKEAKETIGWYVAKHLISFGAFLLIGPGTTLITAMKQLIKIQELIGSPQDLEILTTNLEIVELGNRARLDKYRLFEGLRITLAGGLVSPSMNCLVGDTAATSISARNINPGVVLFGVHGLCFDDGDISLIYRYSDELSIQKAYAVRPTRQRVIVCDATKIGRRIGYAIDVSVETLLAEADECIIITSRPRDPETSRRFERQTAAFRNLLTKLHQSDRFTGKNLALRVLNQQGGVHIEYSLAGLRDMKGTWPAVNEVSDTAYVATKI